MLQSDKLELPRRLASTIAHLKKDMAAIASTGDFDDAVDSVLTALRKRHSFLLATGHGRGQNRLPEIVRFDSTKPYATQGRSQAVQKKIDKISAEIVETMPEACCKFIMCEYNQGEFDPKLVVLFYASDIFRRKLQARDAKLQKPWLRAQKSLEAQKAVLLTSQEVEKSVPVRCQLTRRQPTHKSCVDLQDVFSEKWLTNLKESLGSGQDDNDC